MDIILLILSVLILLGTIATVFSKNRNTKNAGFLLAAGDLFLGIIDICTGHVALGVIFLILAFFWLFDTLRD